MTNHSEFQEAFEELTQYGLPKKKRAAGGKRHVQMTLAHSSPIAKVLVDVQASHLGQTFDYGIPEHLSEKIQVGVRVRVPFGARRVEGIVWQRVDTTDVSLKSLRYVSAVVSPFPVLDARTSADIERIAYHFGGTTANVVRLAVPQQIISIDRDYFEPSRYHANEQLLRPARQRMVNEMHNVAAYTEAIQHCHCATEPHEIAWDIAPGILRWRFDIAWMILEAIESNVLPVVILPTTRHVYLLLEQLHLLGLQDIIAVEHSDTTDNSPQQSLSKSSTQPTTWRGDIAVYDMSHGVSERYRAYKAIMNDTVQCVIGARSAMYAPVQRNACYIVLDDITYQYTDGFVPYPNVREVVRLRAVLHNDIIVMMSHVRSPYTQFEVTHDASLYCNVHDEKTDSIEEAQLSATYANESITDHRDQQSKLLADMLDYAEDIHTIRREVNVQRRNEQYSKPVRHNFCTSVITPYELAKKTLLPTVRWLNKQVLQDLDDPAYTARIPHTAVQAIRDALQRGSVLIAVPYDGVVRTFACNDCRATARCNRCMGGLVKNEQGTIVCSRCGESAEQWHCRQCNSTQIRSIHVGIEGVAQEIRAMFNNIPVVVSTPKQARGIVEEIDTKPKIVIATPYAEPLIVEHRNGRSQYYSYQAAVIVDVWAHVAMNNLDADIDTALLWSHITSLVNSHEHRGQVLLVGECDSQLAHGLIQYHTTLIADRELNDRAATGLPPTTIAAILWGQEDAVYDALEHIGAFDDGDFSTLTVAMQPVIGRSSSPSQLLQEHSDIEQSIHDADVLAADETAEETTMQLPSVLGPITIANEEEHPQFEGANDRVRAVIRVPRECGEVLAQRLHHALNEHLALQPTTELRFRMYPKELL